MDKKLLSPGIVHELHYVVPETKTVPFLFPESPEFQEMPRVLATGFMVGFIEWACIQAINPYIDWPRQQTLGTHIDVSHQAATPPGMRIQARVELREVDGRRLLFGIEARDERDMIARGTHERYIIDAERFLAKLAAKKAPV